MRKKAVIAKESALIASSDAATSASPFQTANGELNPGFVSSDRPASDDRGPGALDQIVATSALRRCSSSTIA